MRLTPSLRKLALTVHVGASAGWLGAVVAFLSLAVAGFAGEDPRTVRSAYVTMEVICWYALVPLALASLVTGVVQGLGTSWGLFRHYWVVFKLVINLFATVVLLLYTQTLGHFAELAATATADLSALQSPSPLLHAALALVLLLVATTLAVYKPRGLTPYGRHKQRAASR